ncbi:MAG: DUF1294 domain-containing protein [Candidatus Magasanikbacteria bacterium CG10_big_fil_rev_8_21_14_0_10_47_10]|uniref:DUF1294 domain-containing protein n=1 Tax=Candidatus Magasanikbacteria bacterium CG10_big_fil_rev_8_21_14_0_10_47_10 TaxID=1974652 RepID=A0A2H0TQB8_9BACT|nr:MAG: DUF1294 domain-containing protein [Candidatus Magasanikbacteria bacterium CG10_big_fil_rev_8_21_14_0_10_47_10]
MFSVGLLTFLASYLAVINLFAFLSFGFDKARSRTGGRRVPEKTLLILALLGGSAGALLAMNQFRHKTKKMSFQAWLAVILAVQIFIVFQVIQ